MTAKERDDREGQVTSARVFLKSFISESATRKSECPPLEFLKWHLIMQNVLTDMSVKSICPYNILNYLTFNLFCQRHIQCIKDTYYIYAKIKEPGEVKL